MDPSADRRLSQAHSLRQTWPMDTIDLPGIARTTSDVELQLVNERLEKLLSTSPV